MEQSKSCSYFISIFVDDKGYTTTTFALAILVSVTLLFSALSIQWSLAKSAQIQQVADACALSGANSVGAYSTIVQVVDCILVSLGVVGALLVGSGFVVCCLPYVQVLGEKMIDIGLHVLDARASFAQHAMKAFGYIERVLPSVIALSSSRVVMANSKDDMQYIGCAIGLPLVSESEFLVQDDLANSQKIKDHAQILSNLSKEREEAAKKRDEAKLEGWLYDCGNPGRNLRERAFSLSSISQYENPHYLRVEDWNFGVPIARSRAYYRLRLAEDTIENSKPDAITRLKCRKYFYSYTKEELKKAYYEETPDEKIRMNLPKFPINNDTMRQTTLYTQAVWPGEIRDGNWYIHARKDCPKIINPSGDISLKQAEEMNAYTCEFCQLTVSSQGKVALATSHVQTGYEYWWKKIQEASERFKHYAQEVTQLENRMETITDEQTNVFDLMLQKLSQYRPKIKPAGALGCIGIVGRMQEHTTPYKLSKPFIKPGVLKQGVAISASCLAPVLRSDNEGVIRTFIATLTKDMWQGDMVESLGSWWEEALRAYGAGFTKVQTVLKELPFDISNIPFLGKFVTKLSDVLENSGFTPADLKVYKPTLISSSLVLQEAGFDKDAILREWISKLPDAINSETLAGFLLDRVKETINEKVVKVGLLELFGKAVELSIELI